MYLLKPEISQEIDRLLEHSHSTMYLLKPSNLIASLLPMIAFTFHHVSIKTDKRKERKREKNNSHSTMYLLKPAPF